jgi:hypothetical protein
MTNRNVGSAFARFIALITRLRMTDRNVGSALNARMCFGSLDFIIAMEGDLVREPVPVLPSPATGLNTVVKAFEELHLHSSEGHALEHE